MTFERKPKLATPALLVAAAIAAGSASQGRAADDNDIDVLIDQASLVKLDRPASEIVVGNPSIADVAVQSSKVLVVTGKSFGETNLIVLDSDGKTIVNKRLTVSEPRIGLVTVYRGVARQTVHCNPNCAPPLVIGDAPDYFETIAKEIKSKQSIGQTSAEGSKQSE